MAGNGTCSKESLPGPGLGRAGCGRQQGRLTKHNGKHLGSFPLLLLRELPAAQGLKRGPGFAIGHGLDLKDLGNLGVVFGMPILLRFGRAVRSAMEAVVGCVGEGQLVVAGWDGAVPGPLGWAGAGEHLHLQFLGSARSLLHQAESSGKAKQVSSRNHPASPGILAPTSLDMPPSSSLSPSSDVCDYSETGAVWVQDPEPTAVPDSVVIWAPIPEQSLCILSNLITVWGGVITQALLFYSLSNNY